MFGKQVLGFTIVVALVLVGGAARAIEAGDDAVASIRVELAHVPNCQLSIASEICLAGYDDAGTPERVSDDILYLYQASERASVRVNTEPLGPLGDLIPNRISVNSRTTTVEHPAFTTLGGLAATFNEMRPAPATPFIEARHGEGGTIFILYFEPITGGTSLPKNAGAPIPHNWWNATDYKHVRPINNDLVNVTSTDAQIDEWFDGAWLSKTCRNAWGIPTEELAPGGCDGLGSSRDLAGAGLKDSVPNVVCCTDTTGGEIVFKPSRNPLSGKDESKSGLVAPLESETFTGHEQIPELQEIGAAQPAERFVPVAYLDARSNAHVDGGPPHVGAVPASPPSDWTGAMIVVGTTLALLASLLYSRLRRDELLANRNRKTIYEAVIANPGITIGEVRARLGLNYHTTARHVKALLQAGMLTSRQDGRKTCLFENGGKYDAQKKALIALLRSRAAQMVALALLQATEATQSSLAHRLDLPATTVSFHARRLAACGALAATKRGRNRVLALRPDWRMTVADSLEARGHDLATRVRKSS